MEPFITRGIDRETPGQIGDLPRGHGFLGLIVRDNRSYRIPEISPRPAELRLPSESPAHGLLPRRSRHGPGSLGRHLYLTDKAGADEFAEDDQALVEIFAVHAGIAIENVRLHEQVQRLAIVDERDRIGQDLHDGIIQSIYAVGLSLEDVPELIRDDPEELERRVERAIDACT